MPRCAQQCSDLPTSAIAQHRMAAALHWHNKANIKRLISNKDSIGILNAFLAVKDGVWQSADGRSSCLTRGNIPMLTVAAENRETRDAIERYVMAAIIHAREVYTDKKWLIWADNWIAGRDRSFASARKAHQAALEACDHESLEAAARITDGDENREPEFCALETPAELAAWAAGLAVVRAPISPDLMAGIRRIEFALRKRLANFRPASDARAARPALAGRAVALARRAGRMLMPPEVAQTVRP